MTLPASNAQPRRYSKAFGNVHVVCNNAGVAGGSGIDDISLDDWRWVLDVNLMGVLHGVHAFLPRIRAHSEGGHFVNTASGQRSYSASKFAVVTMSMGLAMHLKTAWHRRDRALSRMGDLLVHASGMRVAAEERFAAILTAMDKAGR